ncbi:MAG: PQQ-dependent sugar dehydrogenase [bacterium]
MRARLCGAAAAVAWLTIGCGGGGGGSASVDPRVSGLDVRPVSATCIAPPRSLVAQGLGLKPVYPGVHVPKTIALVQAPGDAGHWYAVVQTGRILRFDNADAASEATTWGEITSFIQGPDIQESIGLLGMAFHPNYAANRQVFLYFTVADPSAPIGTSVVLARFVASADGARLDPGSRRDLVRAGLRSHEHNGGTIHFGADGMLYAAIGEGGPGEAPTTAAQDLDTLLGKVIRIDVDGEGPRGYGIPADNPYAAGGGLAEIWARGFRNPWKWSFDRETGELWLGDVGWHSREEVDRVERGGNYGWPIVEGTLCQRGDACADPGLVPPVVELDHSAANSMTGGYVYRGSAMPELVGAYVFGDFVKGKIWAYRPGDPPTSARLLLESARAIGSFAEDQDGELYLLDYATGQIARLVPGGSAGASAIATTLSRTGCAQASDPRLAAEGMVPYDMIAPLWSDGAEKSRWFAVPAGGAIEVAADGDWSFPIGTVLRKDFAIEGKLVETRLLMHHDDGAGQLDGGWAGYSYRWDAAEKEAVLVESGAVDQLANGQVWTFPSGADCLRCHTEAAGRTLGPKTQQLDRDTTYPTTGRTANQVATLEAIGMLGVNGLAAPGVGDVAAFPALDDESVPAGNRARAYLDSNCSHCHRPGGPGGGTADFRATVPFAAMGICNAEVRDDFGIPGARVLVPGDHARSVLWLRLTATDSRRMPPLATAIVDERAAGVFASWIDSLAECPAS